MTMDHHPAAAAGSTLTTTKKRGFDIASLVDDDYKTCSNKMIFDHPSITLNNNNNSIINNNNNSHGSSKKRKSASGFAAQIANMHSFPYLQSFPGSNAMQFPPHLLTSSHPTLTTSSSSTSSSSNSNGNSSMYVPSAFKKVDKHLNDSAPSSLMSNSQSSLPFVLSSLYNMPSPGRGQMSAQAQATLFPSPAGRSGQQSMQPPITTEHAGVSMMGGSSQQQHGPHSQMVGTNLSANGSSSSTPVSSAGSNGKSVVPPSLLPFLPPSLAALSFPQTNWCAKCNATFRMTSDLVYHMRSHHKPSGSGDPIKKKREEKLKCNICGETFRERHHLTRHMTSHQ
jgi:hypothetical protein